MGIPKFFRYISERYPLTSELITPTSIPIFDNLYLDMNGIIHNCTHPPSSEGNASFRLTEQQMVLAIFAYIDHLFSKIKPRKVFFMAVDGVAPRAKMNQQRSRRFRTAQEAKELEEKALRKGEEMPETAAFDSNCITPGTPFMTRLSTQLQYFVNKKIAEDAEWRGVEIILSGHDVPGEGEHKIQEYIRLSKAQPHYNPNTRHCLYGLDADLIMLGLLSHDPHFCLLREEVTFGRKQKGKGGGLDSQNFYLMHLSLLREYLDLEFSSISAECPFEYSLEKVIDDFILISVFVGNDFLPHLPNLHINEGAMETIWGIYKRVLPHAGGYMNESGKINVQRLQLVLNELSTFEKDIFEKDYADSHWHKGSGKKNVPALEMARNKGKLTVTPSQKATFKTIQAFILANPKPTAAASLTLNQRFSAKDRRILQSLADDLHLDLAWDQVNEKDEPIVVATFQAAIVDGVSSDESSSDEKKKEGGKGEAAGGEGDEATARVLKKWAKAKVVDEDEEDAEEAYDKKVEEAMEEWKKEYYKDKLEFKYPDGSKAEVEKLVHTYIEGLQWVMHYYYTGVASWGWFYNYHYAPRISDLINVDKMTFKFNYGKPFHPFEQLMGVLPEASKDHIPLAFRDLMYDPNSPILDFYPLEFEADMNGKKQEWEAVVKIPFIDEGRLLKAMGDREHRLSPEERARNGHGHAFRFTYDEFSENFFPSPIPGFFPDIVHGHCITTPFEMPELNGLEFIQGLLAGVQLGASALAGFPSMATLPHTAQLGYHGVNVHNTDSKNSSMVITVDAAPEYEGKKTSEIAEAVIGKRTFTGWPFLREGLVVGVTDELFRYSEVIMNGHKKVVATPHSPMDVGKWKRTAERIEHHYSKRFGVVLGSVDVLIQVRPLKGLKRLDTGALVKEYEGPDKEIDQALQASVSQVEFEDERFLEQVAPKLADEYPGRTNVFFLGEHLYGSAAQVVSTTESTVSISVAYSTTQAAEAQAFTRAVQARSSGHYFASFEISRRLHISGLGLSRITSTLLVATSDGHKTNLGLSLKFEGKGLKVLGYSRKLERGWEFSDVAVKLIEEYKNTFPDVFGNLDVQNNSILRANEMFPKHDDPDARVLEVKKWLAAKGVSNFEPVTLFAEQLEKDTVERIELIANKIHADRNPEHFKKALIKGLPRQGIIKPAHAIYRLQAQVFRLGDRVVMVQDSGAAGVPLSLKGVVVGINSTTVDVVWDSPFISGTTLGGRCSEYRGLPVPFSSCLNLTNQQFLVSTKPVSPTIAPAAPRQQQGGAHPMANRPNNFFKPAPQQASRNGGASPMAILQRPNQTFTGAYGQAAQGIRPAQPSAAVMHAQTLQNTLRGGLNNQGNHPRPPRPQFFPRPPQPQGQAQGHANVNGGSVPTGPRGGGNPNRGRGGAHVAPAAAVVLGAPVAPAAMRGGRGGARGGRGRGGAGRGGAGAAPAAAAVVAPSN